MNLGLMLSIAVETGEAVAENSRMFGLDSQTFRQVAAQLFNVTLLFSVMTFLLYKPVRKALKARTEKIQGQLSEAQEELTKAQELRAEYEKKLDEVNRERDDIIAKARKDAHETGNRIVDEAKREADSVKERAAASVKMEWERAENEMRTAIIDVSGIMAEKFVSLAINKETHDKLFNETMAGLEEMTWRD